MTDVRITQAVVEVQEESNATEARVTQVTVEAQTESNATEVRITQAVIEVIQPYQCNPPGGIYKIVPGSGKTNDAIFINPTTAADVKIP